MFDLLWRMRLAPLPFRLISGRPPNHSLYLTWGGLDTIRTVELWGLFHEQQRRGALIIWRLLVGLSRGVQRPSGGSIPWRPEAFWSVSVGTAQTLLRIGPVVSGEQNTRPDVIGSLITVNMMKDNTTGICLDIQGDNTKDTPKIKL